MSTMKGKVCLVTGSTNGIGVVTAEALAAQGAEVIVHGRNAAQVEAVAASIRERTGNPLVSGLVADFTSLDEVRRLAAQVIARHPRLDVLVNNAGGVLSDYRLTKDGFEWHFGVNYLAQVLLTQLLLDALKAAAPSRVVNVSSSAHKGQVLPLDDLNFMRGFKSMPAYGRSKFALNLFTFELARRLAGTQVTANALHPGVVSTNIFSQARPPLRWILQIARPLMLTPEKGARTSIYLASSPDVAGVTGEYFDNSRPAPCDPRSNDPETARLLWEKTTQLLR